MDMRPTLFDAASATPERLDFRALVAVMSAQGEPRSRADLADPGAHAPGRLCLVTVILARAGWRQAALALGGCFVRTSRA